MKLSKITRWIGPAAIGYALFLVISDMSGMPLPLVDAGIVPAGSSVMGSGLILWAMVMLLVGMISLYARLFAQSDTVREKAAEREALYREWEFVDGQEEAEKELFERGFGWTVPDEERAEEELLVTPGPPH
jgi:hypothetical protein